MKKNFQKRSFGLLAIFFALPMLMLYQNCSKVGVSDIADSTGLTQSGTPTCVAGDPTCNNDPGVPTGNPPPNTCTTSVSTSAQNVKVFFLMDVSGSNQSGDGSVPATDKSVLSGSLCDDYSLNSTTCKPWRKGVLDGFLNTYLAPGVDFSFEIATFQGSSASSLILDGSGKTIFSKDSMQVRDVGEVGFLKVKDNNSTPYQAVLNMAASAIVYDRAHSASPSLQKYVVIMMTDGMPSDKQFSSSDVNSNIAALKQAVADLANMAPGQITFNTVLYYPNDKNGNPQKPANAEAYLQAMAMAGKGKYSSSPSSQLAFTIDNNINIPIGSTNCP